MEIVRVENDEPEYAPVERVEIAVFHLVGGDNFFERLCALEIVIAHRVVVGKLEVVELVEHGARGSYVVAEVAAMYYEIDPVFAGAFENLRHALDRPVVVSNPEMHVGKDRKFYAFGIVPRGKRFRRNKTSGQQRRTPQEIASFNIHIAIVNRKTPAFQSKKYANFSGIFAT